MSNPWLSIWLSAANSWAGAVGGFWTAEMRRLLPAMINEMNRKLVVSQQARDGSVRGRAVQPRVTELQRLADVDGQLKGCSLGPNPVLHI